MEKKYLISEMGSSDMEYGCGDTDAKIRVGGDVRRSDDHTLRSRKNKGFTLVELIVVIVILAILAAILVPALLGYIDRAKNAQYVLYAKNALTATQSVLTEMYANGVPAGQFSSDNEYSQKVRDLIDDTGLNDAYLVCLMSQQVNRPEYAQNYRNAVYKECYVIYAACYIYQVKAGGKYKLLYNDGKSWTEKGEYTELGKLGRKTTSTAFGMVATLFDDEKPFDHGAWKFSVKNIQ